MKKEIILRILLPVILFLFFYGIGTIQVNCEPPEILFSSGQALYCDDAYDMFILRTSWIPWIMYFSLVLLIEVEILSFKNKKTQLK